MTKSEGKDIVVGTPGSVGRGSRCPFCSEVVPLKNFFWKSMGGDFACPQCGNHIRQSQSQIWVGTLIVGIALVAVLFAGSVWLFVGFGVVANVVIVFYRWRFTRFMACRPAGSAEPGTGKSELGDGKPQFPH